ncbi:MAG: NADH-quinone oxidoreductase subunit M [Candidatus Nanopelagicales bacterium]
MNSFPWLTLLIVIPIIGAIVLAAMPRESVTQAKKVALAVSLITLIVTIVTLFQFDSDSDQAFQLVNSYSWIPALGVKFSLGLSGISIVMVGLIGVLMPLVILGGWNEADDAIGSVKGYYSLMLTLQALLFGVFMATDLFLFYIFFEAVLIPMYFIIGRYGGPQRQYAAVKFLLYSLVGGLLMLVAVIALYVQGASQLGEGTFDLSALSTLQLDSGIQKWIFLGFFIAFAIKAPMWPVHTWLPDAAGQTTPGSAVLMVGVMDKIGTFGMLALCLPLFPEAAQFFAPFIVVLALISIIYGAIMALGQRDIMRLIAYTSVSHFGFIVMGIFAMTSQGMSGATFYMLNHGLSTGALFLIAGFLISRRGSSLIESFGGVHKVAPILAGTFLLAGLSSLSLPGMSSFVSEFLVLVGTFETYQWAAIIATVGIVLSALYILWLYQRTMTGPVAPGCENFTDLNTREKWSVGPIIALIIFFGFFAAPVLNAINPSVDRVMQQVGVVDPQPAISDNVTIPVDENAVVPLEREANDGEGGQS